LGRNSKIFKTNYFEVNNIGSEGNLMPFIGHQHQLVAQVPGGCRFFIIIVKFIGSFRRKHLDSQLGVLKIKLAHFIKS